MSLGGAMTAGIDLIDLVSRQRREVLCNLIYRTALRQFHVSKVNGNRQWVGGSCHWHHVSRWREANAAFEGIEKLVALNLQVVKTSLAENQAITEKALATKTVKARGVGHITRACSRCEAKTTTAFTAKS
jgi:hypothetical protein